MENFIGVYKNAYSDEYCKKIINWFELTNSAGFGKNRVQRDGVDRHIRDDVSIFLGNDETISLKETTELSKTFFDLFWNNYYFDYSNKFSILKDYPRHTCYNLKVQRTDPGGGYHGWHAENNDRTVQQRIAVFTLYLNDISEGGETEFLYYGLRIKPEQGTLIIWPAGYTHTHRGNPPLKETKYIVTGWVEFQ